MLAFGCGGGSATTSGESTTAVTGGTDPESADSSPGDGSENKGDDGALARGPDDAGNGTAGAATAHANADGPPPEVASGPEFPTSKPPAKMTEFLEAPAKKALEAKNWPLAISLLRGLVTARGAASPEALKLVEALVLENQFQEAIEVLDAFILTTQDPEKMALAKRQKENVEAAENPFSREFRPVPAKKEAIEAFELGRKAQKDKRWADALLYFQVGSALDPELPGFLRELGATYDKLKAPDKKVLYLGRYLHRQPFGKNADFARKALGKHQDRVGKLTIESALPCDRVWVNRQLMPGALPVKQLVVGPGRYAALCYNIKYDIAYFEEATVEPGKQANITFNWAVIINGLREPFGRIRVEDALNPGEFRLVPMGKEEGFGVVVPADGRALQVRLQSLDRSRNQTRYLKIAPGSKEVIKW